MQCFLRAFENRMVNCWDFSEAATWVVLLKKVFWKVSRWSPCLNNFTCLRPPTLSIEETPTQLFFCEFSKVLRTSFFRTPPNNCFWILQMKIKLLKTKFRIGGFTYFEVSYANHIPQKQISEGLKINLLNHVNGRKYTSVVSVTCN